MKICVPREQRSKLDGSFTKPKLTLNFVRILCKISTIILMNEVRLKIREIIYDKKTSNTQHFCEKAMRDSIYYLSNKNYSFHQKMKITPMRSQKDGFHLVLNITLIMKVKSIYRP